MIGQGQAVVILFYLVEHKLSMKRISSKFDFKVERSTTKVSRTSFQRETRADLAHCNWSNLLQSLEVIKIQIVDDYLIREKGSGTMI